MELKDLGKGLSEISDSAAGQPAAESVHYPDEESKKATEKAMALLLHKDRTAKELADRLYRAGFSEKSASFAMEYVGRFGYINDRRYAERYVDYHKTAKSKNELRRKLREKGISDEVLAEVFASYAEGEETDPEEEALRALIAKRLRGRDVSELTYEERQKQIRYLAGKGFPSDMIRRAFLDGGDY